MDFIKRILLYFLIFLFIISIYQDLTNGTNVDTEENNYIVSEEVESNYSIIKIQAEVGDTVLTLNEKLNDFDTMDIDEMMDIFKKLNPKSDPYNLTPGEFYFFPIFT